jgi:hypothetical protein
MLVLGVLRSGHKPLSREDSGLCSASAIQKSRTPVNNPTVPRDASSAAPTKIDKGRAARESLRRLGLIQQRRTSGELSLWMEPEKTRFLLVARAE